MRFSKTGHKTSSVASAAWQFALNFCEQKFVQHGPVTIAIDCNGLSLFIFEEKWSNYGPKSSPSCYSSWFRRLFNVCVRVFCVFGKSNVAIFPKVVHAYIQTYSFGGRIKLIICQIRHELSITITKKALIENKTR